MVYISSISSTALELKQSIILFLFNLVFHCWDLTSGLGSSEQKVGPNDFQVPSNLNYYMIWT